MARAIDADAVLDRYYAEFEKQDICDGSQDRDWLMRCIEEAPTLTPPNEPEYRGYTCPNCHHTWLEDRDATDYPGYCPGCGEPLHKEENEPLTLEQLREMNETPIYVVTEAYGSGWCILNWHGVNKSYTYFSRTGTSEGMTATPLSAKTYGDLWTAYRRPPEGEDA